MKLILDAHTVIWAVDAPVRLGPNAATLLADPAHELLVSAATIWEIAIKVGLGKLNLSLPYKHWMTRAVADLGLAVVPITIDYANVQATLPQHHGDPFDRLVIAQALTELVAVVSADVQFDAYGITRLW